MKPDAQVLFVDAAPWYGGAQRSLWSLIAGLHRRAHTCALASADASDGGLLSRAGDLGIDTCRLRARHWRRTPVGLLQFVVDRRRCAGALREIAADVRPNIIHANGVRAALIVPRDLARDAPLVVHDRDLRMPELARRAAASSATRIVAVSHCVADCWKNHASAEHVRVVYNGVDPVKDVDAADIDRGDWDLAVALVADMVAWKRHRLVLEALARLREDGLNVAGVLVGRVRDSAGPRLLRELRALCAARALDAHVRFVTGAASALPWLAACDVLVSASEAEPFGRTVVEALLLGKPVVATSGYGPAEILEACPAGTVVGHTAEAVADGIAHWIDPAVREAAAEPARERARRFSVARMIDGVEAVYSGLAARDG